MPAPTSPELRRRAVGLARLREKPVAQVARDRGIAGSGLRRWMRLAYIDEGIQDGLSTDERAELVLLRRDERLRDEDRDPQARQRLLRSGERAPKIAFPVAQELAADGVPVAVTCRGLNVSTLRYYEWARRTASCHDLEQAYLKAAIHDLHAALFGTYSHRRVHAELTMGHRLEVSHDRVERLMCSTGLQGVHRRRLRGCTRRDQAATPSADLVERNITPEVPDRLYVADVTQHPTGEGWLYFGVVFGCFSPRAAGCIGARARAARIDGHDRRLLLQSRGRELPRDPADRAARPLTLPNPLGPGERDLLLLEGFYNSRRRHSRLGYPSAAGYQTQRALRTPAGPPTATAA